MRWSSFFFFPQISFLGEVVLSSESEVVDLRKMCGVHLYPSTRLGFVESRIRAVVDSCSSSWKRRFSRIRPVLDMGSMGMCAAVVISFDLGGF